MKKTLAAIVAVAGAASASFAAPIITWSFNDAAASFSANTFTASAVDNGTLATAGTVSRLEGPGDGTAVFGLGDANFDVTLAVSGIGANTANGVGSIVLRDISGTNTITADITGTFIGAGGFLSFTGLLSNIGTTGATFAGTTGSFNNDLSGAGVLTGAVVQLSFNPTPGAGFFTAPFQGVATQVSGQIVPTPGAMALFGAAGLAAARRRRR